ncbi:MAG: tRNA pseudouridine(55) synthase TruB [Deltaproteobacteria bacterium]|nr:tRNA pseudouridine(55) synthase TruB [Deltaproteobacteria bacterium]
MAAVETELNGALLVDKPEGITSAEVLRRLERKHSIAKIGHGGTLDPMATGLLLVFLGKATKLQTLFLDGDKAYSGVIRLGLSTDTDDITGAVTSRDEALAALDGRDLSALARELEKQFRGEIMQAPPAVSAIKLNGKRSYELARKGVDVQHEPRCVTIREIALEFQNRSQLSYAVRCSKGTFVRSLARDIGGALGVPACLESIRRTLSGAFSIENAHPLDELLAASSIEPFVLPMEAIVEGLSKIVLSNDELTSLARGNQDALRNRQPDSQGPARPELAAVFDGEARFYGLVERSDAALHDWKVRCLVRVEG